MDSGAPAKNNAEMLPDGTNPEGVDPVPPLNWTSKSDLKDVVIYGNLMSPPVAKIRHHLGFAGVEYKCVARKPNSQPKGSYQKIPSMEVNGRVVNDSYVIVKHLLPALYPDSDAKDLASGWEAKITYGLQLAMEAEVTEDSDMLGPLLQHFGMPSFLAFFGCFPCVPIGGPGRKIPQSIRDKRAAKDDTYGPLKTMQEYLAEFESHITDLSFFQGAAAATAVDISVFATVYSFYTLPIVKKAIADANLSEWWGRMENIMPESISKDEFV